MSYQCIVAKITDIQPHPNADRLVLGTVVGKQVVLSLESKMGDIGVYFPSDGQLSHDFLMANKLYRKNPQTGEKMGGYFEENRRIRIQKFRGEISDGFFCPLSYFDYLGPNPEFFSLGLMFNSINGQEVCNKYIREELANQNRISNKAKVIKETTVPSFYRVGDTRNLNYYVQEIPKGSLVIVSVKMHGTSGRTGCVKYVPQKENGWCGQIKEFLSKFGLAKTRQPEYKYISGTRRTILEPGAYHLKDDYRLKAHEQFVNKLHKGEIVYYEIVGYSETGAAIQPPHDTQKYPDIEKTFGKQVTYSYGCKPGEYDIYVYRMGINNEDGVWTEYPWWKVVERCSEMNVKTVVVLESFVHTEDIQTIRRINNLVNKEIVFDPVGISHPLEGVCLRVNDSVFKFKTNVFCLLEDIAKDSEKFNDPDEAN